MIDNYLLVLSKGLGYANVTQVSHNGLVILTYFLTREIAQKPHSRLIGFLLINSLNKTNKKKNSMLPLNDWPRRMSCEAFEPITERRETLMFRRFIFVRGSGRLEKKERLVAA